MTETGITEPEVKIADESGTIAAARIQKEGDDFLVFVSLTWLDKELVICTTRYKNQARRFKHLGRLIDHLSEIMPKTKTVTLNL